MWLFNVTRELFRVVGRSVEPELVPKADEKMFQQASEYAFFSQDPAKVWVLKVHGILKPNIPRSQIITCHRDIRDVVVSFKEFMNVSFEDALDCGRALLKYTKVYKKYNSDYLMLVAYNDIEINPVKLIMEMAKFLKIQINESDAEIIALKYSKEKVKDIIKQANESLLKKIIDKQPIDHHDIVYFSDSNYRSFDRKTGFQTGHVSERKTGDWKNRLSHVEQQQLETEFADWLKEFGYMKQD
jgi:hypothetical protein